MTQEHTAIEVTQAARKGAAASLGNAPHDASRRNYILKGNLDHSDEVQAFARFERDIIARLAQPSIPAAELVEAAHELEKAEARYRYAHDILGSGDPKTGRAWDLMRRAGDKVREALSRRSPVAEGEGE